MENNYFNGTNGSSQNNHNSGGYDFYEVNREPVITPPPVEPQVKKKKEKKHMGPVGKKFGLCITMALVFGLVAGLVFQGVNVIGNKVLGNSQGSESQQIESVQMVPNSGSDDNLTGDSGADATPVSTGSLSVADISQNAMPSIVAITAVSVQEVPDFFGGTQQYEGVGSGSGIIVGQNDTELLIATNNHVVEGAKNLSVSFYGDEIDATALESGNTKDAAEATEEYARNSVAAQIKGTDAQNDLAVIAVVKSDIPEETMNEIKIATLGNSDSLVVGEQVVAIGNALGYGQSVTSGYVSALDRSIDMENTASGLIQTDAAINPGNSGGALLNMSGEVIGINSAKFADEQVEGMGFAIPVSTAQPILDELMSKETRTIVDEAEAGYLGISCLEVSAQVSQMYMLPSGVFVGEVTAGGPAEKAGMLKGDVVTAVDGTKITTYDELTNQLQYFAAGETVDVTFERANGGEYQEQTISVTLGTKDDIQ